MKLRDNAERMLKMTQSSGKHNNNNNNNTNNIIGCTLIAIL